MRDWDQHPDEVLRAYNSTTGFSRYILPHGTKKTIALTYLYPEFDDKSFETHEAYVDDVLARQQEIHDLVQRNAHQAQVRQKLNRALRGKAYQPGVLVWVFYWYIQLKK